MLYINVCNCVKVLIGDWWAVFSVFYFKPVKLVIIHVFINILSKCTNYLLSEKHKINLKNNVREFYRLLNSENEIIKERAAKLLIQLTLDGFFSFYHI